MNKIEKIILVIALLVIIGGIIIYNINGIKYSENSMKLGDILTPYFIPELISLVLICVYFIIRYRKIGIFYIIIYTLVFVIGIQLLILSIYILCRIPVNSLIMPISMLLYIISFMILTEVYDKKLTTSKSEQKD